MHALTLGCKSSLFTDVGKLLKASDTIDYNSLAKKEPATQPRYGIYMMSSRMQNNLLYRETQHTVVNDFCSYQKCFVADLGRRHGQATFVALKTL